MRRGAPVAILSALLAGCAAARVQSETTIHPSFSRLRPAMVAVSSGEGGPALAEALYGELLAKDYSVLKPGAAPGPETGIVTARTLTEASPWSAEVTFLDPFGTSLYRCRIDGFRGTPGSLAAALLRDLPSK